MGKDKKALPEKPKKTSIGGQALIEGIMMRGPKKSAMAITTERSGSQTPLSYLLTAVLDMLRASASSSWVICFCFRKRFKTLVKKCHLL